MSPPPLIITGAKPTAPEIIPAERCGNCWYNKAIPNDPNGVLCQGVPATPICIGMAQDPLGRANPQLMFCWATMPKNQRRCALWQPKGAEPGEKTQ